MYDFKPNKKEICRSVVSYPPPPPKKANCYDLAEILLKVAIHTITLTLRCEFKLLQQMYLYPDFLND